ncbi:unnamed protein product [Acanthosepion pharaonis]|uniref:Uncharacterized protein n=1 Tax=Acanthosepion pharaonis TaxID=158019 RepID=A0A812DA00_ACAPH|nr:unnamed protein product [Sepia pharaonis]
MRLIRLGSSRKKSVAGTMIAASAILATIRNSGTHISAASRGHPPPLQPFRDRHQRDGDDQRGGHGRRIPPPREARRARPDEARPPPSGSARRATGPGASRSVRHRVAPCRPASPISDRQPYCLCRRFHPARYHDDGHVSGLPNGRSRQRAQMATIFDEYVILRNRPPPLRQGAVQTRPMLKARGIPPVRSATAFSID